jgi:membrane protease subunit HflK
MNYNKKPDIEINLGDIWKRFQSGSDGSKSNKPIYLVIGLLIVFGITSSFYQVQTDEQAVVLRFGKYTKTEGPGLRFKLPFGIDKVSKVKTTVLHQETFGFTPTGKDSSTSYGSNILYSRYSSYRRDDHEESSMLTGDLNVIDVKWVVLYKIADPKAYLFNLWNPEKNIRDISQTTMRRVVGDRMVSRVMHNFSEVEVEVKSIMQSILDSYQMGVSIQEVKLQSVEPPEVVRPAFNEVNAAKQDQERDINLAEKMRNSVIPKAKGTAEQNISEAKGYAEATLNRAKGDAERISALLTEYEKAPEVTRLRIYYDFIEQMLKNLNALTIVDPKLKGIMPVYNSAENESLKQALTAAQKELK